MYHKSSLKSSALSKAKLVNVHELTNFADIYKDNQALINRPAKYFRLHTLDTDYIIIYVYSLQDFVATKLSLAYDCHCDYNL